MKFEELGGRRPITSSELKNFLSDRRKWWLSDVRGLRLKRPHINPTGTTVVGDRYHQGLEQYYQAWPNTDDGASMALACVAERIGRELEEFPLYADELQKEGDLVRIMLEGYFEEVAAQGWDADLNIVGSERSLVVPMFDPEDRFALLAKLDASAARLSSGHTVFLEHKAVSNFSDITKWAHANPQFKHYHLVEFLNLMEQGATPDEADKARTDGLVVNMARTVKRTARATPPFYDRYDVFHNRETLRSYWLRVQAIAQDMETCRERLDAGEDPRVVCYNNPTKDSTWADPFFRCVEMFDDGSDVEGYLAEFYEPRDPLERYELEYGTVTAEEGTA